MSIKTSGRRYKTEKVKTAKFKKTSSTKWLQRQINDPYVQQAKEKGYRCRAVFKILEIDNKFKIFKQGQKVLDLGSAPGGWSQVIVEKVGKNNIIATDILEMKPISGVIFLQQDFLAKDATKNLLQVIKNEKYDIVMSDLAANTTGDKKTDHIRTTILLDEALNFALTVLKPKGVFIGKIFQGGTEPELFNKLKQNFKTVKHFKPESSRKDSVEMYVVAMNFKN